MLLNESLKEHGKVERQQRQIEAPTNMINEHAKQLQKVTEQLTAKAAIMQGSR